MRGCVDGQIKSLRIYEVEFGYPASEQRTGFTCTTAPPKLKRPLSPRVFQGNLAGLILSLPAMFRKDSSANYAAVGKMIARARKYRIPVFELTAGNSKYSVLTYDEIKGVIRAMAEATEKDGSTIAAPGSERVTVSRMRIVWASLVRTSIVSPSTTLTTLPVNCAGISAAGCSVVAVDDSTGVVTVGVS